MFKVYALTMAENEIVWRDAKNSYFRPDIVFCVNRMQFVPNIDGVLFRGCEFAKGLYAVQLCRLGAALSPVCNTLSQRVDLDVITQAV